MYYPHNHLKWTDRYEQFIMAAKLFQMSAFVYLASLLLFYLLFLIVQWIFFQQKRSKPFTLGIAFKEREDRETKETQIV